MVNELHLWMTYNADKMVYDISSTIYSTEYALRNNKVVHTTIPYYLSFDYAERLFVHMGNIIHEIKIGKTEGTDKEIRKAHNLEKMLMTGVFDWFQRK